MDQNTNTPLIETTVKTAIKRIQNDPERSIRNLVDLALMFCNGRFQQRFLNHAHKMLEDENSSLYRIIPEIIKNVDSRRITTFGINIGYHSCTNGARIIRKIEAEKKYNIPWCISLRIHKEGYLHHKEEYFSVIEQGKQLGIFTWIIDPCSDYTSVMELAAHFMDCAFVIQAPPKDITDLLLLDFHEIYNVLFSINMEEDTERACKLLHQEHFLYSICYIYGEDDLDYLLSHDVFYDVGALNSPLILLHAKANCPIDVQLKVYEELLQIRNNQMLPTVPFDLIHDLLYIDEIISTDAVSVTIDADGICTSNLMMDADENHSIFKQPLDCLLQSLAKKTYPLQK